MRLVISVCFKLSMELLRRMAESAKFIVMENYMMHSTKTTNGMALDGTSGQMVVTPYSSGKRGNL